MGGSWYQFPVVQSKINYDHWTLAEVNLGRNKISKLLGDLTCTDFHILNLMTGVLRFNIARRFEKVDGLIHSPNSKSYLKVD